MEFALLITVQWNMSPRDVGVRTVVTSFTAEIDAQSPRYPTLSELHKHAIGLVAQRVDVHPDDLSVLFMDLRPNALP